MAGNDAVTYVPDDQTLYNNIQNYQTDSSGTVQTTPGPPPFLFPVPIPLSPPLTTAATITKYTSVSVGGTGTYETTAALSAGSGDSTAGQTAMNNVATKTTGMADLYLMASNNINQKAFGPLSEITYGDSYKNVQGNTTDIFSGTYYKETHGTLISASLRRYVQYKLPEHDDDDERELLERRLRLHFERVHRSGLQHQD